MPTQVLCRRQQWRGGVELMVLEVSRNGKTQIAELPTLRDVEEGAEYGEPTFRLDNNAAQQMIDELWNCGYRPTEGTGSAGSLAATERHLKDMQAIAMGLLRKDGVQA